MSTGRGPERGEVQSEGDCASPVLGLELFQGIGRKEKAGLFPAMTLVFRLHSVCLRLAENVGKCCFVHCVPGSGSRSLLLAVGGVQAARGGVRLRRN